jgi:CheY-like chemotaxis protein
MQISSLKRKINFMSQRILVVERSRTIQTLLSIYFRSAGHQVLVYSTPQEALQVLADLRDAPDRIFLAIHAHEQDDYRLIQHVKAHAAYARTSLVALVLQEDLTQIQRRLRDAQVSYLVKPFRVQDALALVSVSLPGSVVPSETQRG